jgi:hypothetical protein
MMTEYSALSQRAAKDSRFPYPYSYNTTTSEEDKT